MAAILKFAAISIIAAALLAAACSDGDDSDALEDPGRLIAPGRTHLSLCVDSAGGRQAADADVDFVQNSLEEALAGADYIASEFGVATTAAGCPPPLELSGTRITDVDRTRPEAFLHDAALVSPHLLFVYLVTPEDFIAAFGIAAFDHSGYDIGTAEWLCSGPRITPRAQGFRDDTTCESMTSSVYVPDDVSRDKLADVFLNALGLRTTQPAPTIDWHVCERNSAEAWCIHYEICTVPPLQNPEYCEDFWTNQGAGLTPPPPIDTSAWPTFSSPLGFDIKYPPGWTVDNFGSTDFAFQRVRIRNELSQKEQEARSDEAPHGFVPLSGEAWIDVWPDPLPHFDENDLAAICGTDESRADNDARPEKETVDGRPAIRCIQSAEALGGEEQIDSNMLWVEHPPGRSVHIGWTITGEDQDIIAAANAALATITFHE